MVSKITIFILTLIISSSVINVGEAKYSEMRKKMVQDQIFLRGITDKRILDAFSNVKRHLFVEPKLRDRAYDDTTLDIGEGQDISQPYYVAVMTYAAAPEYNKKVLEIGTGSGYHTAILAELVKSVYTIEIAEPLAKKAKQRLNGMGYKNVYFRIGDGYQGWAEHAPYDSIIVTCNEDHIPQPLINQLAVGGRMIIPVSYSPNVQELILLEKVDKKGDLKKTSLIPVQIVPMRRGTQKK